MSTKPQLTANDYAYAAGLIGCDPKVLMAVAKIEAGGSGFLPSGEPRILFEAHKFDALTQGRFRKSHPHLSSRSWDRSLYSRGATADERGYGEHRRLAEAVKLDRLAALQAASWGKFQILGENFSAAGFNSLQAFINAMYKSELEHLLAFVHFVKAMRIDDELRREDFDGFARVYNGPAYRKNDYAGKMRAELRRLRSIK